MRSAITVAALALCALALTSCTVPTPSTGPDGTAPTVTSTPSASASPSAEGPISVVTIAGADVDGTTVTVAGYVTQVSEEGGSCAFELTSELDGTTVDVQSTPAANMGTTSCGTVQVPVSSLSKGTWSVVLKYSSDALDLTSAPVTMEVP